MSPEEWLKQQGQSPKPMSPEEWAATQVAPAPKTKTPEPTFGQQAYAGGYGLVTGLLGGPGEVESMFIPPDTKPELAKIATVFPTVENVRAGAEKLGLQPAKGTETAQFVGEISPLIVAGGKGLYDLTKFGLTKGKDLAQTLLGKKTEAQAEKVGKAATEAEKAGGQALGDIEKQKRKLLEEETAKALQRQQELQTRQSIAQRAGAKATGKGERSLRDLVGVRTIQEAGSFKPIPQTPTQVGNFIREQAENFVKSIKTQRDAAAKQSFANARNEAALKQSLGQYVDTQPLIQEIDRLIAQGGSTDYIRSISQLRNDLAATKDFEGLEVIRRRLGDAAFGLPEEGYKAIGQGFAKDMYKNLADQMKKYSSDFEKYLDDYKRLSKTIEAHATKVGKSLTETQDAAGKYYTKTAEQVANDIFSSPEKFKTFVDAVGGNLEIATSAARKYFAGKLESAKTPEAVEKILKDSRELLKQPGMASVKQDVESYLASLRQSGKRAEAATAISEEATSAQKLIQDELKAFDKQVSAQLKGVEESKKLFSDAVSALSSAKPGAAIKTFEETVLPKIRQAEAKAGTKLLSEQQIQEMRQQVQQLEKISDQTTRTRVISGVLATYLIGQEGVSKLKKLAGMPSGE